MALEVEIEMEASRANCCYCQESGYRCRNLYSSIAKAPFLIHPLREEALDSPSAASQLAPVAHRRHQIPEAYIADAACTMDHPREYHGCRSPDLPEVSNSPPIHCLHYPGSSGDRDRSTFQGLREDRASLREYRGGFDDIDVHVAGAEEAYVMPLYGDESARCDYASSIGADDIDDGDRCPRNSIDPAL